MQRIPLNGVQESIDAMNAVQEVLCRDLPE